MTLSIGPYKAYDLMTYEFLGGFDMDHLARDAFPDRAIEVVYRPSKRKVKK